MLTPAAWNAFLKTLEEPPPNTIFVLATTEANKVLPTVVDRCHRFDFGRPAVSQIASVLRRVATPSRSRSRTRRSRWSRARRPGRSATRSGRLEQLLAYSGSSIALEDVLAVLGAADADLLFGTVDAIADGDARSALLAAARLAESGRDLGRFFGDLEAHARGLMIVQVLGDVPPELHITPEQDQRLAEQAERVSPAAVVRLLELIAAALRAMKDGADARTQLELALVKAATPELEPSVKALQTRLERLETRRRRRGEDADARRPPPAAPRRRPTPLRRPRARPAPPPRAAPDAAAGRCAGPERRRSAAAAPPRTRLLRPPATPTRAAARTSRSPRRSRASRRWPLPRRCPARPPTRRTRSAPPTTPRPRWRRSSPPRPIRRRR